MNPKKIFIFFAAVVAVVVALGIWIGFLLFGMQNYSAANAQQPSKYYAVYMATGDIYFGKMDWFPWPHLKNVWFVQRAVNQNNQAQLGVVRFDSAFWGPVDELYLNPKEIVFWTRLSLGSQFVKCFDNPASCGVGAGAAQQFPSGQVPAGAVPSVPPSQSFRGPSGPPPSGQ